MNPTNFRARNLDKLFYIVNIIRSLDMQSSINPFNVKSLLEEFRTDWQLSLVLNSQLALVVHLYLKLEYLKELDEKFKPFRDLNKQEILINLLHRVIDIKLFQSIGIISKIIYLHNQDYYNK